MTTSAAPLFKGIAVQLDGIAHVMPRLSFGGFEDAQDLMRKMAEGEISNPRDLQNAFVDVLHLAFKRNYPDMPRDLLKHNLDWDSAPELFNQLMAQSIPQAPAGEMAVASQSGASTGKRQRRK